jgi:hypothetical protein
MRVLRYVLSIALGIALPLAAQLWDRRRLDPEQRERAWNAATWGGALYAFSVFSMLGWCWVTRGGFPGWRVVARAPGRALARAGWALALGLASTAVLLALLVAADRAVAWILRLPPDP